MPTLIIALVALCAVFAPAASAAKTHPYTGVSFGPDGVGGSESFESLRSVALDPTSGDVYAYDPGKGSIYKFDSSGAPSNFSSSGTNEITGVGGGGGGTEYQVAVAPAGSPAGTAGDIYVANNSGSILVYSAAGDKLGEIEQGGETCGVGTDPAGNLYAGIYSNTIKKFTPTANPPTAGDIAGSGTIEHGICNVAADGLGNVYGANYGGGGLFKLEGLADSEPAEVDGGAWAMSVDPTSNDLYADRGSEVAQYDSSGALIGTFGAGDLSVSRGLAIAPGGAKVYAATDTKVKVFGALVVVPGVTIEAPTGLTGKKATFHGIVNPAGLAVTGCEFEYEVEGGPTASVPCEGTLPTDEGDHAVSAEVSGLTSNAQYTVRLVAANANGSNKTPRLGFATLALANTEPATQVTATSATLNGKVAPEGEAVTECFFEYGKNGSLDLTAPCEGAIPTDENAHPVSAAITGLNREGEFSFRLVIKQGGTESKGSIESFETAGARVRGEGVGSVGLDEATLEAEIDPRGAPVSYFFEYGSSSAYGERSATASGGSGEGFEPVQSTISGLAAGTEYHWRLVVVDPYGQLEGPDKTFRTLSESATETGCPNQAFRTGPSAFLPDCRAYEQASPIDKAGGGVEAFPDTVRALRDGSGITFYSQAGIPGGVGAQDYSSFLSSRNGESWTTQGLLPPQNLGARASFLGLTEDGRYAITEAAEEGGAGLFARNLADGAMTTIFPYQNECGEHCVSLAGSSADGSKVYLEAVFPMTGQTPNGQWNLYVWNRDSGEIKLVDVKNPAESSSAPELLPRGGFAGPYNWISGETTSGGAHSEYYVGPLHAISPDGDQVIFTAAGGEESEERGQLYLRQNPDMPQSPIGPGGACTAAADACTVRVSAPMPGVPDEKRPAAFLEATPDGHYVFFKSAAQLTEDAYAGEEGESQNLYRYDVTSGTLTDLTPDPGHLNENGPRVQGMLGAGGSGRLAYFVAKSALPSAPGPGGSTAVEGEANVYRYDEQASPSLSFVATLKGGSFETSFQNDSRDWSPSSVEPSNIGEPRARTARVSADGETLVLASYQALTGISASAPGCGEFGVHPGEPSKQCSELFRYSAASNTLDCLSCSPSGGKPLGIATFASAFINAADFPLSQPTPVLSRNLSTDGNRFFFQTPDPLVGRDVNGKNGCALTQEADPNLTCLDVYEWEAPGTGSCTEAEVNGGCLYLLSSGESHYPSLFADADPEGKNAFIFTEQQLTPSDRDELYDAYDVSEGGGLASQHESPAGRCESQQACQGPASSPGASATPGSSTLVTAGNPKPKPSRCHKAAKKCKKHHKKRHHKKKHAKKRIAGRGQGGSK